MNLDPERVRDVLVALLQVIPTLLIAYAVLELPADRKLPPDIKFVGELYREVGPRARFHVVALASASGIAFCVVGALIDKPGVPVLLAPINAVLIVLFEMTLTAERRFYPSRPGAGIVELLLYWIFLLATVVASGLGVAYG